MKNENYKGTWIPGQVMEDEYLTQGEKFLYSTITHLSNNDQMSCNASNAYLAQRMSISPRRVQQLLSSLKNKGYITTRNIFHEGTNRISHRVVKISARTSRRDVHVDNIEDRKAYIENNIELDEIFCDFIKYRQELKKPLRESSLKVAAQKLVTLSSGLPRKAREIVNQTIERGWLNLFELKDGSTQHRGIAQGKILKAAGLNDYSNLGF